jgi:predicted dehydrogenase
MIKKLTAAVIGVGMIGRLHAMAYWQNGRTALVGVVDADFEKAKIVAQKFETRAYRSLAELISSEHPEILSIAVREDVRYEIAIEAARSGAHLLLEKPLAPNLSQADSLLDEIEKKSLNKNHAVNFILRADQRYAEIKRRIDQGALGDICTLFARRRGTSTGAEVYGPWTNLLISTAIHDIDVITWTTGATIERVYAESIAKKCAQWNHEDAVVAILKLSNGAIANLETSWVLPPNYHSLLEAQFDVVGTGGNARITGSHQGVEIFSESGYSLPELSSWPIHEGKLSGALRNSIDDFIDSVFFGRKPLISLIEARNAQSVVAALQESLKTGQATNVDLRKRAY